MKALLPTRFFLVLGLTLPLLHCAADAPPDERIAQLRTAEHDCREELAQAHYLEARDAAAAVINKPSVLAADDVLVDQVRFCYATARTLKDLDEVSSNLNTLITAIFNLVQKGKATAPNSIEAQSQSVLVDDILHAFIDPLVKLLESNQEQYDAILAHNRFHWEPARVPIYVADQELLDAKGEYDLGEIRILSGMNRAILGDLYMLRSLTYPLNLQAISTYATLDADTPLKHFQDRPLRSILNALTVMLGTHKDFLTLDPANGLSEMRKAGASEANAVDDLLVGIDAMKARKGDQTNHIIEYKRDSNNDYFIVHIKFKTNLNTKLELDKYNDTTIWLKEDVAAGFQRLRDSINGVSGARANLQKDIFPIAALISVVLLSSGALDAVIDEILKNVDPVLADELRLTADISSLNQDYVLAGLLAVVPMDMEIDFNQMFQKPAGLRAIVPAWYQPVTAPAPNAEVMSAFTTSTFVVEYECAGNPLLESTKNILCNDPVDAGHFAAMGATPWLNNATYDNFGPQWKGAITADGTASRFPYIGFKDPTFGHVLYIDVTKIAKPELEAGGMLPATQKTLNATLAEVMDLLITIY